MKGAHIGVKLVMACVLCLAVVLLGVVLFTTFTQP
jgi:hypothetical protein